MIVFRIQISITIKEHSTHFDEKSTPYIGETFTSHKNAKATLYTISIVGIEPMTS